MLLHVWISADGAAEQNEHRWPALLLLGALKSSLGSRRSLPVETAQAQHFITVSPGWIHPTQHKCLTKFYNWKLRSTSHNLQIKKKKEKNKSSLNFLQTLHDPSLFPSEQIWQFSGLMNFPSSSKRGSCLQPCLQTFKPASSSKLSSAFLSAASSWYVR